MALSIPILSMPIPAGHLSVLLETVIILPLKMPFLIVIDIFIKNILTCNTYALKR